MVSHRLEDIPEATRVVIKLYSHKWLVACMHARTSEGVGAQELSISRHDQIYL